MKDIRHKRKWGNICSFHARNNNVLQYEGYPLDAQWVFSESKSRIETDLRLRLV